VLNVQWKLTHQCASRILWTMECIRSCK
jgi:hypothetical protein